MEVQGFMQMSEEVKIHHQSQLLPEENKFHVGNGEDGKYYWLTPPDLHHELNQQYQFDFDPCPYPLPDGFDGLTCEWGKSNYVNPPFGSIMHQGKKKGPTAWVRKAIAEQNKGKDVVLVYPVDKWLLMLVAAGAEIKNLGDVRWLATEDNSQGKGTGRHIACFVLKGKSEEDTPFKEGLQMKSVNETIEAYRELISETNFVSPEDSYDMEVVFKEMESLRQRLAEAKAKVPKWQTMDSAPNDGDECLLLYKPDEPRSYAWMTACYFDWENMFRDQHGPQWVAVGGGPMRKPTHYMPLPAPPEGDKAL